MTTRARPDWRTCRVVETEFVADNARRITLERPVPLGRRAEPGSHVDVRVRLGETDTSPTDMRSYSVVECDDAGRRITVTVQLAARSRGGSAFMHRLKVGDTIEATRPLQDFPLVLGADRYVLLAGGIGVTALVAMARTLARLGADYDIVYVGRSRAVMAYADLLADEHGDRLAVHVDEDGTSLDVQTIIDRIKAGPARTELLMCGPVRLMDAVRRAWTQADLSPTDLRFETFGNSGWFDAEPFEVSVPELGISTTVSPEQTMLDALSEAGADLMWDCRKGECGLCVMAVDELRGRLDHRDVFLSDRQKETDSRVCLCVTRVVGDGSGDARISVRTP